VRGIYLGTPVKIPATPYITHPPPPGHRAQARDRHRAVPSPLTATVKNAYGIVAFPPPSSPISVPVPPPPRLLPRIASPRRLLPVSLKPSWSPPWSIRPGSSRSILRGPLAGSSSSSCSAAGIGCATERARGPS
jgi:hypothetical protein